MKHRDSSPNKKVVMVSNGSLIMITYFNISEPEEEEQDEEDEEEGAEKDAGGDSVSIAQYVHVHN